MNPRVFHKNTIEFITVCKEYVAFCEDLTSYDPQMSSVFLHRLLPLIYLKASLLPTYEPSEGLLDEIVSEDIYNFIQKNFEEKFGEMDLDCEIFDINTQDNEKNTAPLSEILTDIYQDLKTVLTHYETGDELIMESSLYVCKQNFELFWGQRLTAAMQILHILNYLNGEWWNDLKPKKNKRIEDIDTSQWIISQRLKNL
ncbi:MAG: DUF5063 domain-containing protein [Bacteroidales bacterium]